MNNDNLIHDLKKINHMINRHMSSLRKNKSEMTQFLVGDFIHCCAKQGRDCYNKDVSKEFSINKSSTSELLKKMENNGLIQVLDDQKDARVKKLVVTDLFLQMEKEASPMFEEYYNRFINGLTQEEIAFYHAINMKIMKNIEEE